MLERLGKIKRSEEWIDERWADVWNCWHELNESRPVGFGDLGGIQFSEIRAWLSLRDVPRWRWDWFVELIGRMERLWRQERNKQHDEPAPSN